MKLQNKTGRLKDKGWRGWKKEEVRKVAQDLGEKRNCKMKGIDIKV